MAESDALFSASSSAPWTMQIVASRLSAGVGYCRVAASAILAWASAQACCAVWLQLFAR